MVLPFCDEEQYSTCLIDIDTLGLYYGLVDAFIAMFFLAGYLWVHAFIKDEFETVKKATVTAGGNICVHSKPDDDNNLYPLLGQSAAVKLIYVPPPYISRLLLAFMHRNLFVPFEGIRHSAVAVCSLKEFNS